MDTVENHFPSQSIPVGAAATEPEPQPHAVRVSRRAHVAAFISELLQTILLTVAIFLGVRSVVQNFRVEGASMEPTLQTGQYLLINKATYFHIDGTPLEDLFPGTRQGAVEYMFAGPQRGDVVVFRAPTQPDKDYIKRIIGLPGDMILIRNGRVSANGEELDEPYLRFPATYNYPANGRPMRVPDTDYFVLGDNRPNSSDSHLNWTVPVSYMVGQAWFSYWPPQSWGPLAHVAYAN